MTICKAASDSKESKPNSQKPAAVCKEEKDSSESLPALQKPPAICKVCNHDNSYHDDQRCKGTHPRTGNLCNMLLAGRGPIHRNGPIKKEVKSWQSAKKDLIQAVIDGDRQQIASIMLEFTEDVKEARMIIKEVAPYLMSKKATSKEDTVKDTQLNITFTNPDIIQAELDKAQASQEQIDQESRNNNNLD